jgi:hypothetical protein
MIGPLPVALLGLAGFVVLFGVTLARVHSAAPLLDFGLFTLALGAALYVTYLSYVELFVLGAVCPWCVVVALCAFATLAAATVDVALTEGGPADLALTGKRPNGEGRGSQGNGPDGTASVGRRPPSLLVTEARRHGANARERTRK